MRKNKSINNYIYFKIFYYIIKMSCKSCTKKDSLEELRQSSNLFNNNAISTVVKGNKYKTEPAPLPIVPTQIVTDSSGNESVVIDLTNWKPQDLDPDWDPVKCPSKIPFVPTASTVLETLWPFYLNGIDTVIIMYPIINAIQTIRHLQSYHRGVPVRKYVATKMCLYIGCMKKITFTQPYNGYDVYRDFYSFSGQETSMLINTMWANNYCDYIQSGTFFTSGKICGSSPYLYRI